MQDVSWEDYSNRHRKGLTRRLLSDRRGQVRLDQKKRCLIASASDSRGCLVLPPSTANQSSWKLYISYSGKLLRASLMVFLLCAGLAVVKKSMSQHETQHTALLKVCDHVQNPFEHCLSHNITQQPLCRNATSHILEQDSLVSFMAPLPTLPRSAPDFEQLLQRDETLLTFIQNHNAALGVYIHQHLEQANMVINRCDFCRPASDIFARQASFVTSLHQAHADFNSSAYHTRRLDAALMSVQSWAKSVESELKVQAVSARHLLPLIRDLESNLKWADRYTSMLVRLCQRVGPETLVDENLQEFWGEIQQQRKDVGTWRLVLEGLQNEGDASSFEERIFGRPGEAEARRRDHVDDLSSEDVCWIRLELVLEKFVNATLVL